MGLNINGFDIALQRMENLEEEAVRQAEAMNRAAMENRRAVEEALENKKADEVHSQSEADVQRAMEQAAIPLDGSDLLKPLIDLLEANQAYLTSLAALKVTADVESDAVRLARLV